MSDAYATNPAPGPATGAAHDEHGVGPHESAGDRGGDHRAEDHADGSEALGPLDLMAWGAGALGIALGLVVAFCMVLATSV